MFDTTCLRNALENYQRIFVSDRWNDEKYKWEAIKHFQENWDINASDFADMLARSLSKTYNLLSSRNNFASKMIEVFAQNYPEEVRSMFVELFDENKDIYERIEKFKKQSQFLCNKYSEHDVKHFQDEHAISTYLWLRYPDKYYIFKFEEAKTTAAKLKSNYMFKKGDYSNNLRNCYRLYDEICQEVKKDYELVNMFKSQLTESCYSDPELKILAGDVAFYISRHYSPETKDNAMNNETNVELNSKEQECLEKLKKSHQIILTGAPGTGKSYAAHEIANELTGNKAENIEFVQFHPSMDYTDFVEGLRPIKDNNGQIGFERQDGIFKAFCKRALKNWQTAQKSEEKQREERSIEQQLDTFLNDAVNEEKEFKLGRGSPFTIQYSQNDNDDKIYPKSVKDIIKNEPEKISYTQLLTLLKERPNITSINDITAFFYRKVSRQSDSYLFSLYNEITKWMENNKPQISVPDQKEELENFVFIIDEINRGDISKIFGELFFAIDPSYRGKKGKITTQYQNLVESDDLYADGFYIPENVYIIGTMNDIDRGVESMDFAIRRRFTWIEVDPNDTQSMLDSEIPEYAADAKERMGALNKVISTNPSLGKPYQIGAAYFLRLNELNGDFDALWAYHLEPLLLEYLRGDPRAEEFLDEMKKTYGVEAE